MTEVTAIIDPVREFLRSAADVLLILSAYWSLLLIRCAFVSMPLLLLVRILRRIITDRYTWLRVWCWSLMLLSPFFGKLRFWYESPVMRELTGSLYDLLGHHTLLRVLWPAITAGLVIRSLIRAGRLRREIDALPREVSDGVTVSVTPLAVSPFSTGLIRPRIVIPGKFLETMSERELADILLHERIHIRLGHLWIFALWDLLCALLFPNLLLFRSSGLLREDLEALCDRVTMRHARLSAYDYGRLILRSHRFTAEENVLSTVTLTGERTYEEARRRILRICTFRPYRPAACFLLGLCCAAIVGGALVLLRQASYPRWEANPCISTVDESGRIKGYYDEEAITNAVSWDREKVVIHRALWEQLRSEDPGSVDPEHFWISFDSFSKLPGIGGGGQMVEVDLTGGEEDLIIPYEWTTDFWTEVFRYL